MKLGVYEHYKGNLYRVFGHGIHTETGEEVVIYTPLYEVTNEKVKGGFYIRPLESFLEEVVVEGKTVPRFKSISEEKHKLTPET